MRIAVTLGDPRGIGPEIARSVLRTPPPGAEFVVIGPDNMIEEIGADRIGVGRFDAQDRDERHAGTLAARAVEKGAELALSGSVDGLVTAPINKHALKLAGVEHPGHTEWLGALAGVDVAMMLVVDRLRVVLVTTHLALRDVPAALTTERVVRVGRTTIHGLRRLFDIDQPRLAVCALNPHAGERGRFGDEETTVLAPAVAELGAVGPLSADTVFVRAARGEFDAVLAPYHDVGMTAIKVAGFGRGVNVTLGLPFVRTSPDHGTAMDIVGTGRADPGSMREAVELAIALAARGTPVR